ncbi:MAG: hypothetical protein LC130_04020 [Bryobacterales bacterium]|nr:hypothetical protein [Bryobacterales bacterium]
MLQRCGDNRHKQYSSYGGRGISVCQRWKESFVAFLDDMGKRPDGTTLDRIDNDGNYEPGNCRWATDEEQNGNRRGNIMVTIGEDTMCLKAWCRRLGADYCAAHRRLTKLGWPLEEAVGLTPHNYTRRKK